MGKGRKEGTRLMLGFNDAECPGASISRDGTSMDASRPSQLDVTSCKIFWLQEEYRLMKYVHTAAHRGRRLSRYMRMPVLLPYVYELSSFPAPSYKLFASIWGTFVWRQ